MHNSRAPFCYSALSGWRSKHVRNVPQLSEYRQQNRKAQGSHWEPLSRCPPCRDDRCYSSKKCDWIEAPFDGELEPSAIEQCALYSTPEIPAYLFRLCGLKSFTYGAVKAGKPMGKGDYLSFATLRRQPDGTWTIVEPAESVLEKVLGAS